MADALLLKSISDTLVNGLQTGLSGLASTLGLSSVVVALDSPATIIRPPTDNVVSVFFFRVDADGAVRNHPPIPPSGRTGTLNSLAIKLSYLITPFALNRNDNPLLLGAVMQILWEQAVIPLVPDSGRNLRVEFRPLSVSDMAQLWRSLALPYQLSVTYQVSIE
jgi:hypothetical protein